MKIDYQKEKSVLIAALEAACYALREIQAGNHVNITRTLKAIDGQVCEVEKP